MIRLIENKQHGRIIQFTPRIPEILGGEPTLEKKLIYGYFCPTCRNVVLAAFLTDKRVRLADYEESRILSHGEKSAGSLSKVIPNLKEPDNSAYKVDFIESKDGNLQVLTMKNHVIRWHGLSRLVSEKSLEGFPEPGERPCFYSGIISLREEDIVKNLFLVANFTNVYGINPTFEEFKKWLDNPVYDYQRRGVENVRIVRAFGKRPPMLLVDRGRQYHSLINLCNRFMSYLKNKRAEEAEALADQKANDMDEDEEYKEEEELVS